jgi:signal transduction histidine kinase
MAATNVVLTTTAELRALSRDEAMKGLRFDIAAQILHKYTGRTGCAFTVNDQTGGIRMTAENNPISFTYKIGDIVRWRGVTSIDTDRDFCAKCDATDIVGNRPLPQAVAADPDQIQSGKYNYTRIAVSGRIVTAFRDEIDPENQYLVLESNDCPIYAATQENLPDGTNLSALVGAEVELTGVCVPTQNGRRIFLGPRLQVSLLDGLRILRPPQADRFAVPYIGDIHHVQASEIAKLGHRRVDGVVTATWQENMFILHADAGNLIRVELSDAPLPACGEYIAVVGCPATDLFHLNLSQAIWKPLARKRKPAIEPAADISAQDLLFDDKGKRKFRPREHGRLIRLSGKVRSLPPKDDPAARMTLDCDGNPLIVDASSCPAALAGLEVDCIVRVTGVCVLSVQNWNPNAVFPRIEGMFLVPRSPADIQVIKRPPWWTPKKLAVVIGCLFTLLAIGVLWVRTLNRVIQRRTRQLTKERLAHEKAEARIDERTRLAVELHDALSQTLTGVAFQIDAAEAARTKNPSKVEHYLSVARRTLASCREELRNCLWDLQNHALNAKDAAEAVRETLDPHTDACDVDIDVNMPRARISDQTFHAVLRIVRELVVNAIRHGKARHIKICGRLHETTIAFSVSDDGIGFDPETRPSLAEGHFGLHGISERVERLSGSISIDSAPGRGTRVDIKIENKT